MKQNWEIKKLGEVVTTINGLWKGKKEPFINVAVIRNTNFSKDCILKLDDVEYLDVEERQFKTRKLQYGDVIIEKSGGSDKQPVGRPILFTLTEGNYSFSNFTSTLRIKDDEEMYPEFLQKYLYHRWLDGDTRGLQSHTTGIHNLDFKAYLDFSIPVPPLAEQRRIVSILDEKFAQIETLKSNAQKNLDNTEQLWKAQLEKKFDNKKWEKKQLGEVAKVSSSKRIYADELSTSGVPFLRVSDVVSRINGTETCDLYMPEEKYLSFFDKGLVPKENDVLVTSRGTLGLCYIIQSTDRFYFQDGMITWLALKNDINPKFIYYLFDSQIIKKQIATKAAGAAVSYISITDIKNFEIPIPPLAEQERIVKELDALSAKINTLKANYRRQIECCDELRQSLLKKAFEGEL